MKNQYPQTHTNNRISNNLYSFRLMMGSETPNGQFDPKKTVGVAFSTEGRSGFTLKLWTFLNERFHLVQRRNNQCEYLIFSREQTRDYGAKPYSYIVGNGTVDPIAGVIKLYFDLIDQPIYMNIYPEPNARQQGGSENLAVYHDEAA